MAVYFTRHASAEASHVLDLIRSSLGEHVRLFKPSVAMTCGSTGLLVGNRPEVTYYFHDYMTDRGTVNIAIKQLGDALLWPKA